MFIVLFCFPHCLSNFWDFSHRVIIFKTRANVPTETENLKKSLLLHIFESKTIFLEKLHGVSKYKNVFNKPTHTYLPIMYVFMCLVSRSCSTLLDPMHCSPPGSSVHGILQARILEWATMPSSRWFKRGMEHRSLGLQADSLPSEPPGKPMYFKVFLNFNLVNL